MILEYINRKEEAHYLISKTTVKGNVRYYTIKDKTKYPKQELLVEVPQGFEFFEYPEDAKVVLRKILKSTITPDEIEIIEDEMKGHATVTDYKTDKTENAILVFVGHLDREEYIALDMEKHFIKIQSYKCKLKFEKTEDGQYKAQRFCSLSAYYRWIVMETSNNLEYLAHKYCFHIDKESLFDFWIEGKEDW